MTEAEKDIKQRNRAVAENESRQQTTGDIRVSVWAIGVTALIGLAVFGWLLAR